MAEGWQGPRRWMEGRLLPSEPWPELPQLHGPRTKAAGFLPGSRPRGPPGQTEVKAAFPHAGGDAHTGQLPDSLARRPSTHSLFSQVLMAPGPRSLLPQRRAIKCVRTHLGDIISVSLGTKAHLPTSRVAQGSGLGPHAGATCFSASWGLVEPGGLRGKAGPWVGGG